MSCPSYAGRTARNCSGAASFPLASHLARRPGAMFAPASLGHSLSGAASVDVAIAWDEAPGRATGKTAGGSTKWRICAKSPRQSCPMTGPCAVPCRPLRLSEPDERTKGPSECETGGPPNGGPPIHLTAQTDLVDQRGVAALFLDLEIVEEAGALRSEVQKATAAVIVLLVVLEVFRHVLDALGEDGGLDFRRPCVALGSRKFRHQFLLALDSNRHRAFPF